MLCAGEARHERRDLQVLRVGEQPQALRLEQLYVVEPPQALCVEQLRVPEASCADCLMDQPNALPGEQLPVTGQPDCVEQFQARPLDR